MTVDEYRKKHKRCKTCIYAEKKGAGWRCEAKGSRHDWSPGDYALKGCFCRLYKPREFFRL